MAIAWQTTYYPSLQAYAAALRPFAVPAWLSTPSAGLTIHHTWKPTESDWRGARTMEGLRRFYAAKGWPAGPHLFLAPDGIWAGTPLAVRGVHGAACNTARIGLEVVGNFDLTPWSIGLRERVYTLSVELLQWLRVDQARANGHRECPSDKSCPGGMISMHQVRSDLANRLYNRRFVVTVDAARVRTEPRTDRATLVVVPYGTSLPATPVRGSAYQNDPRWAKVRLPSGRAGYIWEGLGRLEEL